ncbi:MAG: hypothetical protein JJU13_04080 [Balneolaceae bacterium]|nr:hypothetical protein [Balneolaceae bacterium]
MSKIHEKTTPITPEFTDARLTNYAGMIPFSDFLLDKLDFGQTLARHLDLDMGGNCQYQDWQIFGLIIFGYLCGYRRLAHFEQLSHDSTLQKLLGLYGPIDENTLAYRFKEAGYKTETMFALVDGSAGHASVYITFPNGVVVCCPAEPALIGQSGSPDVFAKLLPPLPPVPRDL